MRTNNIRIGKDIPIRWTILRNGKVEDISGLELVVTDKLGNEMHPEYTIEGGVLIFTIFGAEQKILGGYRLTIWANRGQEGQNAADIPEAFRLVKTTDEESMACDCDGLIEPLQFESNLVVPMYYENAVRDANGCPLTDAEGNVLTDNSTQDE